MKAIRSLLVLIAVLHLLPSEAYSAGPYLKGTVLVQMMREYRKKHTDPKQCDHIEAAKFIGYCAGVHDSIAYALGPNEDTELGQICAVVAKFLEDHPERWNEPAAILVVSALKQAFPKRE